MALAAGTRLGAYEITGPLGAGGMGEVYRATDTKLGREVAIKTLPTTLAADQDRLARFEREAKLLAALNHAHIGAIYGLDEHEDTLYITMELVEGETLEQKLKAGPLPIDDALRLALQIAEALEAAHDRGVVHRDLKPANVMVTADGQVKVLDFGLAKAFSGDPNEASPAHSPALSVAMTQQGLILGTAGYMSPEQASGQATDQRADIWAFGVVLYEMLTGLPLFSGESVPHILADVLRTEPDWSRLPKNLHPRLKLLLERCLEKKVRNRYHSIADVRVDIEKILTDPHGVTAAAEVALLPRRRALPLVAATALVTVVIAALVALSLWPGTPQSNRPERVSVMVPANRAVALLGWPNRSLALSPDGTQLVYVAQNRAERHVQLEVRSLASLEVRDLPGTTDAGQPFFSPDGQWVGFFTGTGELKKISLAGGNPITLAEKINGSEWGFGVWTNDGTIVFGAPGDKGLRRVSAEGGEVTDLAANTAQGDRYLPAAFVPDSRAVLFSVYNIDNSGSPEVDAVLLDSGERRVVLKDAYAPWVLRNGGLLFQRKQSILIAPFDTKQLSVTGATVPFVDAVRRNPNGSVPFAQLAVSQDGTLAYLPADDTAAELGLVGRDGSFEKLGLPAGDYTLPRVSPDGQAVAFLEASGEKSTVRIYDLQRGTTTNLGSSEDAAGLAWRPGGRSLAVSSIRGRSEETRGIVLENLDGTKRQLVPSPGGAILRAGSWSPDGKRFSYVVQTGNRHDISVLTIGEKGGEQPTTAPFIDSAAAEYNPQFSPDGRWLAFASDESGRNEVYVQAYPKGERLAVSTNGGSGPVWRPDGKELFFQSSDGGTPKLMAVSVVPEGDTLKLGKPVGLFALSSPGSAGEIESYAGSDNDGAGYDVLPDGQHFVMVRRRTDLALAREIVLVRNWSEQLSPPAPTN